MPRCFSLRTRQLYSVFFNLKATCETFIAKTNDLIEAQMDTLDKYICANRQ